MQAFWGKGYYKRKRYPQMGTLLGLLLLLASTAYGQFETDSLANLDTVTVVNSNTSRLGINTYALRNSWGSGTLGLGNHRLGANIISDHVYNTALDGPNKFVSADILTSLQYRYLINTHWDALGYGHVLDYGANRNRIAWVGAGLKYKADLQDQQQVTLRTVAELVADKRSDLTDVGPGVEVAGQYRIVPDSTSLVQVGGRYWQAHIKPRNQLAFLVYTKMFKEFSQQANSQLVISYRGRRIEDYLPMNDGLNIQSITSDTATADLKLNYAFSEKLVFRSINNLMLPNRNFGYRSFQGPVVRQNSFYKQGEWDLRQSLTFTNTRLFAEERFELHYRDRAYGVNNNLNLAQTELDRVLAQEKTKDITEAVQAWYTSVRYIMSERQQLSLNTVAQLLRVDTRSDENNQDRDEVFYSGELGYRIDWLPSFRTELKTSGSYKHLVYITASQSLENFQERILRFEPGFTWHPGRFSLTGNHSLFVTYHVRDFEGEQAKNRSNRILLSTIQSKYRFDRNYVAILDLTRRENRLSQLNWERFAESPIDTVVIWDVTAKGQKGFSTTNGAFYKLDLGYRMFRQSRASTAGLNDGGGNKLAYITNVILQHGPVLGLQIETPNGFSLNADFWIQTTTIYNEYKATDQAYNGAAFSSDELNSIQRNFFPNFNVSFNWLINRPRNWRL